MQVRKGKKFLNIRFKGSRRVPRNRFRSSTRSIAQKALRVAYQGQEAHKFSQNGANQRSGSDFVAYQLSNMAEGDTSTSREGLKIHAKKLVLKMLMQWDASANSTDEAIRILVIKDKCSNGALPVLSDIIDQTTGTTYSTVALRKRQTEGKRYEFLYDKLYVNPIGDASSVHRKALDIEIPLNFPIWYLNSGTTSTAMGKNNLYLFLVSDQTLASAVGVQCWWTNRVYYDA